MNLPGAQVTPRCCWLPVGSGSTDPWASVRGWCDPAQLRGCGGKLWWRLRDSGIVSGLVTVTAQLPRPGLQTPLACGCRPHWSWHGISVMPGGWCWVTCGPLAAVTLKHEGAPKDSPRECWWLQHFAGGIWQDFGFLLDFRWNFFLLCGHISQVALCLFSLRVIFTFSFWDWYMCPHIYIKYLIFLYKKKLMTQGTSQLYYSNCSIAVCRFNKGIREVVTTNSSMYERLKALWDWHQLVGNVYVKPPYVYLLYTQFCFTWKMKKKHVEV